MKISIVIERKTRSVEEILENIAKVVEKVSKKHPDTICPKMIEVTITEKR